MIHARIVGFRVTFSGFLMHFGNNTVVKRQLSTISPKFLSHSWHWRGGHHWSSFGRRRFHWRWQRRRRHLFSRSHPLDLLLTNPFIISNLFEAGPLENHGEPHTWTCSPTSGAPPQEFQNSPPLANPCHLQSLWQAKLLVAIEIETLSASALQTDLPPQWLLGLCWIRHGWAAAAPKNYQSLNWRWRLAFYGSLILLN